ncbi:hypothetical protein AB0C12_27840 [Actinoplanes sp. NPDC048967]|uniref:hypothetical protein n=1 Tax=Actinoplanes sp. NPDC048967 TaxID=3155269 RepID=UPI0033E90C13
MTVGKRGGRSQALLATAVLPAVTALTVAVLAVATNVGTEVLPAWDWLRTPWLVWSAVGVLTAVAATLAVAQAHRPGGGPPSDPAAEIASRQSSARRGRTEGMSVGELTEADALALEVHRAVLTDGDEDLPLLPRYVERPFDHDVRESLRRCRARGGVIMLIGESSTGKTRACWEAMRAVLPDWRVWHPLAPERPEALVSAIEAGTIAPRTVIWLNEAQLYLGRPGVGERVASELQQLIGAQPGGPVIVLGSMWPNFWNSLTDAETKDHPAARALLQGSAVPVPSTFHDADMRRLRLADPPDPRLGLADRSADGRITQFLAGAPQLLDRYRNAGEVARAVLWAAVDLQRLTGTVHLPAAFLRAAASGYLTASAWDQTADDWFETATDELCRPARGVPGPLTARKPAPGGAGAPTPAYRLADVLAEAGRSERSRRCPPGTFWKAAAESLNDADQLLQLARAATVRGRYHRAYQLSAAAAWRGSTAALEAMAWMRLISGDAATARRLGTKAVARGDSGARIVLALACDAAGDEHAAAEVARQAIRDADDPAALLALARRRRDRGLAEQAAALLLDLPPGSAGMAVSRVIESMRRSGSFPPGSEFVVNVRYGDQAAPYSAPNGPRIARAMDPPQRDGSGPEASAPTATDSSATDPLDRDTVYDLVRRRDHARVDELMERMGRMDVAVGWWYQQMGDLDRARRWFVTAIDRGEQNAMPALIHLIRSRGEHQQARQLEVFGLDDEGRVSRSW